MPSYPIPNYEWDDVPGYEHERAFMHYTMWSHDMEWLIEKAELALDLDAFVTTQEDRARLDRIVRELRGQRER